jgi:hypothetical protein
VNFALPSEDQVRLLRNIALRQDLLCSLSMNLMRMQSIIELRTRTTVSVITPIVRTTQRLKMQGMEEHRRGANWMMSCVTNFEKMASAFIAKSQVI